jgi:predicted nucleotidyltransferase
MSLWLFDYDRVDRGNMDLRKGIRDIAERFDCELIYFFGSQAEKGRRYLEGEYVKADIFSDLDIAVAFRERPTEAYQIYGKIYKEMSELLEPFNVDLVFMHELETLFQWEIIRGLRVYEKNDRLTEEFEEEVLKRAEDIMFKKRILKREIMEAIEDGYIEFEYSPNP